MKNNNIGKYLLYLLLIFPFFKPRSISVFFPFVNKVLYVYLPVLCFFIIIILTLKNKKYSPIINCIFIFCFILILSTLYNSGDLKDCIQTGINIASLCLVINYGLRNDTKIFLTVANCFLQGLIFINLFSILISPNGMYIDSSRYTENWFLGYKNIHILFIIPALIFNVAYSYFKYDKLNKYNYFFFIICLISLLLSGSGTSLTGLIFIFILMLFTKNKKSNIFNTFNYLIVFLSSYLFIIIFRLQNYFKFIIVDLLHKDITFTGRIYIWDDILAYIKKKWFLGYGNELSSYRFYKTRIHSYHAHNQILEITYQCGILGLITFIVLLVLSAMKLYKYRDYKISNFLAIIMFSILIMTLTEAYLLDYFLYLFVIFYNVKYLIRENE